MNPHPIAPYMAEETITPHLTLPQMWGRTMGNILVHGPASYRHIISSTDQERFICVKDVFPWYMMATPRVALRVMYRETPSLIAWAQFRYNYKQTPYLTNVVWTARITRISVLKSCDQFVRNCRGFTWGFLSPQLQPSGLIPIASR